uniref:Testis cDNA, clone: QtsA-18475, similar to human luteinizing hormone/choriogonadotropin receptor(LHCGR) n=1 Tax=Macaca fascicularis TaxID=9541 RepID=Q4R6B6_MACFA|nr:unnamed protein product [Macaca fascicularis]
MLQSCDYVASSQITAIKRIQSSNHNNFKNNPYSLFATLEHWEGDSIDPRNISQQSLHSCHFPHTPQLCLLLIKCFQLTTGSGTTHSSCPPPKTRYSPNKLQMRCYHMP